MSVSEQTFLRLIHEDPESKWELHCGALWRRPIMTFQHGEIAWMLAFRLQMQLDLATYSVRAEAGHVRRSESRYYVPDVIVFPVEMARQMFPTGDEDPVFPGPLPFIAEVWSPSTGRLDVNEKLPEYQARGDAEIWLLHPRRRTLATWVRQPDGGYTETVYHSGIVRLSALSDVTIDLDDLFNA